MKTRKEWKIPEGYKYPYFTTKLVAEILGLNPVALSQKRFKYATELAEGVYLWTEENVLNMIKTQRILTLRNAHQILKKTHQQILKFFEKWICCSVQESKYQFPN